MSAALAGFGHLVGPVWSTKWAGSCRFEQCPALARWLHLAPSSRAARAHQAESENVHPGNRARSAICDFPARIARTV